MRRARLALPVLLALVPTPAFPQTATAAGTGTPRATIELSRSRDTYHYHFDNRSRFDTAETVPHYFEQDHRVDATWISGRARYDWAGRTWETDGGVAPGAEGTGSDYDTFFNPDGNVIVYGTTAVTSAFSLFAGQTVELGERGGFRARVGYRYERDQADYHASFSVTTMTRPPSRTEFWNTSRETTVSELHEIRFGLSRSLRPDTRWHVRLVADVSPASLARLTTLLPDKYPDDPIVFVAKSIVLDASLEANYRRGTAAFGVVAGYSGAWNYSSANAFSRQAFRVGGYVGF
jgi:hypothetical protein